MCRPPTRSPATPRRSYAKYLTSTATRGDYYTRDGEGDQPVPSRWHGSPDLLRSLGLDAEEPVARSDLRAVMQGFSPLSGEPLRPAGSNGTRVAGVELMMAPPKSVSALWATAGPYRRAQIEAAHRRAVASALARTEREVALVQAKERRGRPLRARQEPARRRVRPHLQPPRPRPGGRRHPRPPAALPPRPLRRRAHRRQARRDRIAPALPLRPRERRLVPGRAGRRPCASWACRSSAAPAATAATSRSAASPSDWRAAGPLAPKTSTAPPASSASATAASHGPASWAR